MPGFTDFGGHLLFGFAVPRLARPSGDARARILVISRWMVSLSPSDMITRR